jgi:hypothetical protein
MTDIEVPSDTAIRFRPVWDFAPQDDLVVREIADMMVALKLRVEGQELFDRMSPGAQRHFTRRGGE